MSLDDMQQSRRSIRNIPVTRRKRTSQRPAKVAQPREDMDERMERPHIQRPRRSYRVWVLAGISLVVVVFAFSMLFERATVTLTPRTQAVSIDARVSAESSSTASAGDIRYTIIEVTERRSETVEATTVTTNEETRARGTITILNEYSQGPVTLIERTRFESPDGYIYRIEEAVNVPGYTIDDEGRVPGEVVAEVVAEEVGSQYNVSQARFTIPGLAGTASFDGMYARIATPISGGVSASDAGIDPGARREIEQRLTAEVRNALEQKVSAETPPGFVYFEELGELAFETVTEDAGDNQARIRVTGKLSAPLIEETTLAEDLLAYASAGADSGDGAEDPQLSISGRENLTIEPVVVLLGEQEPITFDVSGEVTVVWEFDESELTQQLAGSSKDAFNRVLNQHTAISNAQLVLRPFWKQSLPENPDRIEIINTFTESQ